MSGFLLYIDPAATSVLISSLTAIFVALAATAIIIWRKVKKGVTKTLHIDPNAHKEVEEDLVINEAKAEEPAEQTEQKTAEKQPETKKKTKKSEK